MSTHSRGGEQGARGARPRRRLSTAARLALLLFGALVLLGMAGGAVAVAGYVALSQGLPDPRSLEDIQLPEQSVVFDRTGKTELGTFGEFNRDVVTFDQIPPVLVDATTAVEDRTFWDNAGFDPVGIVAAGVDALRGNARGASTITQQLVRQRLLTTNGVAQTQVSIERKLREIIQSIRVTEAFPGEAGKQRIMAAYLNQNYYGNEAYGVQAAAQSYFGKDVKDLSLAQAAILAAIPKAPSSYDLVQNAEEECTDPTATEDTCKETQLVVPADAPIVQRRNLVLDLMAQGRTPLTGSTITPAEFAAAKAEPVVLAPQKNTGGLASQFVIQVRKELTARLCPDDSGTCPMIERGGLRIVTTLDLRLQQAAEKWVKAAVVVPHAKDPAAAAKALGLKYEPWMRNLRPKDLRNGALVAQDYQTGELLAYVGSADPTSTKVSKKFQPRFDVLSDGWRQPGSAFKPVMYASGIDAKKVTAGSMFMDVVTDFGGGYTPTDADNLERGPVRLRDALRFSLNIPAVKAGIVIGNDVIQKRAEKMGIQFKDAKVQAGASFPLGVEVVHPVDLVGAYGALANGGKLAQRTTILSVDDGNGTELLGTKDRPEAQQAIGAGAAGIITDILAGNTDPSQNPFWGKFGLTQGGKHRPATLKTGTNNDARDLNAYGYIGAPSDADRKNGEYALAVGVWNGNSDNSLVSTAAHPLFSIDVATYEWQGFLQDATKGWSINQFHRPDGLQEAKVDPWTGLAAAGGKAVTELFLPDTAPSGSVPQDARCGEAVLETAGFEKDHASWLAADRGWLSRAERGPGIAGGPERTRTAFFYNGLFRPYGNSWGPLLGQGGGCASPSPSPSPSCDPTAIVDPSASVDPNASPVTPCASPTPSESPSAEPTQTPEATPPPTEPPTPEPTPEPTPKKTPEPTPTPAPTEPPSTPTPAPS